MKVFVENEEIFELADHEKKVIQNDIRSDEFEEDIKRRLKWILKHKFERCFERLKKEWEPKLKKNGVKSIPLDEKEFEELVFKQPEYKNISQRDTES